MNESINVSDRKPFSDSKVEWYSDDFQSENASVLRIEKIVDSYKVIFVKSKGEIDSTYSVRFCNSGSRYMPYNIIFMNMYNKLCLYDPSYHQVNMEEYLYNKRLIKKK